jgi:hypothetical protein
MDDDAVVGLIEEILCEVAIVGAVDNSLDLISDSVGMSLDTKRNHFGNTSIIDIWRIERCADEDLWDLFARGWKPV